MTCRGFRFKEGETYEEEDAVLCKKGFHACEAPFDCFEYYVPGSSVYHEVELDEVDNKTDKGDTKICARKIIIGKRLTIYDMCKAQLKYIKGHCKDYIESDKLAVAGKSSVAVSGENGIAVAEEQSAVATGNYGIAVAHHDSVAVGGLDGIAVARDYSIAATGDGGTAVSGYRGKAVTGDCGIATAGHYGTATAGERGVAVARNDGTATVGDNGIAVSRGNVTVGENGVGVARGANVWIRGGMGALLVIAKEEFLTFCSDCFSIKSWKSFVVDGKDIKSNTWYRLDDNGELCECDTDIYGLLNI